MLFLRAYLRQRVFSRFHEKLPFARCLDNATYHDWRMFLFIPSIPSN